jgi:hypothetical protein
MFRSGTLLTILDLSDGSVGSNFHGRDPAGIIAGRDRGNSQRSNGPTIQRSKGKRSQILAKGFPWIVGALDRWIVGSLERWIVGSLDRWKLIDPSAAIEVIPINKAA